jgi:hypothetical protein
LYIILALRSETWDPLSAERMRVQRVTHTYENIPTPPHEFHESESRVYNGEN